MDLELIQEVALMVGRFFYNPLLYFAIVFAIILGYWRVKRERKFFSIRILNGWSELKGLVANTLIFSAFLSGVVLVAGLTVPLVFLHMVIIVTLVAIILNYYHLLSSAVTWTVSFLIVISLHYFVTVIALPQYTLIGFPYTSGAAASVVALIALLLVIEGIQIKKYGAKFASPVVEKTNRGLTAIGYKSKMLSLIPTILVIPGQLIESYIPWWPQITLGNESFTFVLFPIVIGFQQMARKTLPIYFYPQLGNKVKFLGFITGILAIGSYFYPLVAVIGLPLVMLARWIISSVFASKEKNSRHAVLPTDRGVMIVAVLPDSPAEKMGLLAGEVVKRVNGQDVKNERELYEALQINAAHCRLEVLDYQNEIRLTQHVVHNNDNHKIGLIVVK